MSQCHSGCASCCVAPRFQADLPDLLRSAEDASVAAATQAARADSVSRALRSADNSKEQLSRLRAENDALKVCAGRCGGNGGGVCFGVGADASQRQPANMTALWHLCAIALNAQTAYATRVQTRRCMMLRSKQKQCSKETVVAPP